MSPYIQEHRTIRPILNLLLIAAALLGILAIPACSSEDAPSTPPPGGGAGAYVTALPASPPIAPNVVEILLPAVQNAKAVWGATGRDSRGHIWVDVSTYRVVSPPSAHLIEYVPESGEAVVRGDVVTELRRRGLSQIEEGQSKIHSKIIEGPDGHLYFASMDVKGADLRRGSSPPRWGSHLWRLRMPEVQWEHLLAVPKGLIAISVSGKWVYALGFFDHKLYQYDCTTGTTRSVVVGAVEGHVSRNFISDYRGHAYVPRLTQTTRDRKLVATLVEYSSDLREIGETPLEHYVKGAPADSHGITAFQFLADGAIAFVTHPGHLYRIVPRKRGTALVESMGWFHPEGPRYVASLFTYAGERYLLGLATGSKDTHPNKSYEWVLYDLETRRAVAHPFDIKTPDAAPLSDSLLYGSMTRDNFSNFYVVGSHYPARRPLLLQAQPASHRTGAVRVAVEPEGARRDGVRWRVDGGEWRQSGDTVSGLPFGAHAVEFADLALWRPPPAARLVLVSAETRQITGTYRAIREFIVDNKDSGSQNYFKVLSGEWNTNNAGTKRWPPDDQKSADYGWTRARSGAETARAEWASTVLPAGQYEVSAWWPVSAYSMGRSAAFEIHHAGGVETVRVDQNVGGGQWNSLGTYTFGKGSHVVRIHNGQSGPGKYVIADAVKFVRASP